MGCLCDGSGAILSELFVIWLGDIEMQSARVFCVRISQMLVPSLVGSSRVGQVALAMILEHFRLVFL